MKEERTIPLLHDHHNHPSQYAAFFNSADLSGVEDKGEAIKVIEENTNREDVNVVLGWNNSYYSFTQKELDELPPVIICNLSFHGFVYNKKAEEMVEERYEDQEILKRLRDLSWMESNLPKIMGFLIEVEGLDETKLDSLYESYLDKGIWKTEDMLLPSEEALQIYKDSDHDKRTDFWTVLPTYEKMSKKAQKDIKGIKMFTDGALGPKTAAIKESYPEGNEGELLHSEESLSELIEKVDKENISIHAIGDRAIGTVVNTLSALDKRGLELPSTRIEHAQFIDKETAERAKSLGITLSMQPNFSMDSSHYSDRLSEKYLRKNNPFRMLIDEVGFVPGENLIFGSDGMPHGVKAALESSLFPSYDSQRLTLDEFINGYCTEKDIGGIDISIDEKKEEIHIEKIRT
ncbi:MAG: amidohydrolase family protein [Thermoplasmata archaeon]